MSRPVTVTISHDLGKEEARRRVRDGFDKLKRSDDRRHDVQIRRGLDQRRHAVF